MVKYKQKWTSLYNYSFKYGGMHMYMKTNLKEEKTLNSQYPNDLDNNDELYLNAYFNIRILNDFIDKRIDEISTFYIDNENFKSRSTWLNDWKTNGKEDVFINIYQVVSSGNLKGEKLIKLNKRIERYFKYFDLINKEHNFNDKYEEMFNTLIQIPSEIYSFIKEGNLKQNGKFIKNEYHYNDNKRPSSVCIDDGLLNLAV